MNERKEVVVRRRFTNFCLVTNEFLVKEILTAPVRYVQQLRNEGQVTLRGLPEIAAFEIVSVAIIFPPTLLLSGVLTQNPEIVKAGLVTTAIDSGWLLALWQISRARERSNLTSQ